MQGKIVIGTEIDTKGLEQGVKEIEKYDVNLEVNADEEIFEAIEKHIYDFKKDIETEPIELEFEGKSYESQIDAIKDKLRSLGEEMAMYQERINNPNLSSLKEEYQSLLSQTTAEYEKINNQLAGLIEKQDKYNLKVAEMEFAQNPQIDFKTKNADYLLEQIRGVKKEYDKLSKKDIIDEKDVADLQRMNEELQQAAIYYEKLTGKKITIPGITDATQTVNVNGLKNGFESLYKGAKKLAMGILGVRAAYGLIRKVASSYLADNEKTANRITNIWTGLGTVLGGVIEGIVRILKKAVTAVLYFISVLTGVNYIAKANAAILKKQAKATAGLRKEQQKLNASFDEMEVLQDNSSGSGGISSGLGDVELFDVKELGNAKEIIEKIAIALKPVWEIIKGIVKFALEHPGVILGLLAGAKVIGMIAKIMGVASAGTGLAGLYSILGKIAAIGVIVIGIKVITDNINKIKTAVDENKKYNEEIQEQQKHSQKVAKEIIKAANAKEYDAESAKKAAQAHYSIVKISKEHLETTKKQKEQMSLAERVAAGFDGTLGTMNGTMKTQIVEMSECIKAMKNLYDQNLLNEVGTKQYAEMLDILSEALDASNYDAQNLASALGLTAEEEKEFKEIQDRLNDSIAGLAKKSQDAGAAIGGLAGQMTSNEKPAEKTSKALAGIGAVMDDLIKNNKVTLKVDADTSKANTKLSAFFEKFGKSAKTILAGIGARAVSYNAKGAIYTPPKLAVGGIINRPGRGVPIGSAIGGERGAEGVIPLTDAQQMALLGEAIGKYININATIPVQIGNRLVAREIKNINAEDDFATNR